MKSISLEDAINRDIGEIGTPERDKFEEELKAEIDKGEAVEIISYESSGLHLHNVIKSVCPDCNGLTAIMGTDGIFRPCHCQSQTVL
jgi:hypothetical protein